MQTIQEMAKNASKTNAKGKGGDLNFRNWYQNVDKIMGYRMLAKVLEVRCDYEEIFAPPHKYHNIFHCCEK